MKKAFTTIMLVGAALLTLPSAHADDEPWFELTPGIGQQICRTVYNAEKQGWPGRDFAVEQWWDPSNPNGLTKKHAEHLVDEAIDTYCQSGEPRPPQARASGEVKGLVQGAAKGQACSNFTRFRFGKGSTGSLPCEWGHFPNYRNSRSLRQWKPPTKRDTGWVPPTLAMR